MPKNLSLIEEYAVHVVSFIPSCRSAKRRVSCHAVPLAWLVGKPADSSGLRFPGAANPESPVSSVPLRLLLSSLSLSSDPRHVPRRILAATKPERGSLRSVCCSRSFLLVLACSWLCSFLPAVGPLFPTRCGSALSYPLWDRWVRFSVIHHVVLDLRLLCLPGSSITVLFTLSAGIKQVLAVPVCPSRHSRLGFSSCVRSPASMLASASVSLRERRTHNRLCNVRPRFRQGSWLSLHVLTHVFSSARSHRVLRVVWWSPSTTVSPLRALRV